MNFKVIVVKNIGAFSYEKLGKPGTIHEVKNGVLKDMNGEVCNKKDNKLLSPADAIEFAKDFYVYSTLLEEYNETKEGKQ